MTPRKRVAARAGSRLPALLAALAIAAPGAARADAGLSDGGGDAEASETASGNVRIDRRERYVGLYVDGASHDELLATETFPLPAGPHVLRLTGRDAPPVEVKILVRAGDTMVVDHPHEEFLGGVAPRIEPRSAGCCGGSAPQSAHNGYAALGGLAVAAMVARRRKRDE